LLCFWFHDFCSSGTKQLTFEKYPSVAGWEWLAPESDEWQVDHSKSFGDTDDEGEQLIWFSEAHALLINLSC
jgi:hypothetical protein